jgi:hypothetical protein
MKKIRLYFARFAALCAAVLCGGCHIFPTMPPVVRDMGPRYHPSNVYVRSPILPPEIRRVAILPVTTSGTSPYFESGIETLEPLLFAELEKTKRFEVVQVSPAQLRQWTGKPGWRPDETLPPDLFAHISEPTGCDAVLFAQLTRCNPYQPIAVGWKFCLVSVPPPGAKTPLAVKEQIIWAVDEVLDAGEPGVANAARDYYVNHLRNDAPSADNSTILSSPACFGQYSLAALLETLPVRALAPVAKAAKVNSGTGRYRDGNR